jgi:hypothetical protein
MTRGGRCSGGSPNVIGYYAMQIAQTVLLICRIPNYLKSELFGSRRG